MINRSEICNIGEVSYVTSAHEAKKIILQYRPHIVLTDICMPDLSGLELIKSTTSMIKPLKFIIFSGHDNFEYARSALKLNVIDYLLKPVSMENLRESLKTAIKLLQDEEHESILQVEFKQEIYRKKTRDKLESLLSRLFQYSDIQKDAYDDTIRLLQIEMPLMLFCVTVIDVTKAKCSKMQDIFIQIQNINSENYSDCENLHICEILDYQNNIIIIYNIGNYEMYNIIIELSNKLLKAINEKIHDICVCGVSEITDDLYNIANLYTQAIQALSYKLILDHLPIIEYLKVKDLVKKHSIPFNQVNEFIEDLKNYKIDKIFRFIDAIFNKQYLLGYSIDAIDRLYRGIANIIWVTLSENKLEDHTDGLITTHSIRSFESARDMRIYLKDLIFKATQLLRSNKPEKSPIEIAKEYIRENIGKMDINMAMVANLLNMNYTYFSMLFKKETGMNFSEFLVAEKMKEAQKLICDSSYKFKIHDIAVKLGYNNPKNFTRAYKRFYGSSPSEYQKKQL